MPDVGDSLTDRVPSPAAPTAGAAVATVAYFTMEVALEGGIPTYAGGLGVLAGDLVSSAADLGMPFVAVTLLYRGGYFRQEVDSGGNQVEEATAWRPADRLEQLPERVEVGIDGRSVAVAAWRLVVGGEDRTSGVPVLFLDTDLPENASEDRVITDRLYGGDNEYRLRQEVVLGIGGHAMLDRLGYRHIARFHMNEGHAALLTVAELEAIGAAESPSRTDVEAVRARCVFTTHTPVAAGHDRFCAKLVTKVLGERRAGLLQSLGVLAGGYLDMTSLGAALSDYVNAVSRRHAVVTRAMLPGVEVPSITNGVHHVRWASPAMRSLFDEHIPGWRQESALLRYASELPPEALASAHNRSKEILLDLVADRTGLELRREVLTVGFARRITPYKRALLFLTDPERLGTVAERHGGLQFVCSGKAHPRDEGGKEAIADLVRAARQGLPGVEIAFVENYDLAVAAAVCAGSDLWLNTPRRPLEASGTSGMKAALNGVPSLSILDGWWLEGCVEGVTGWAIGDAVRGDEAVAPAEEAADEEAGNSSADAVSASDADSLYTKLDAVVAPLFYGEPAGYLTVMRSAIALNGSFFTTDRMAREYAERAYGLAPAGWRASMAGTSDG